MPTDYHTNGLLRSGSVNKSRTPSSRNEPSTSDTEDQSSNYSSLNRRPPAYAFILPNLEKYPEDFRRFIERDIIEIGTLRRLESSGHLNWWCINNPSQRLWPLLTTGDGNCLLHASSLAIWGVHDRQLNLRQLLHEALTVSERRSAFYRRWRWHESKVNLKSELILSEGEWNKEWTDLMNLSATTPRVSNNENGSNTNNEQIYESLELIHVYALANVLKRPVIVVSDTVLRNANGESLSPIPFGGIFLPLEINPQQCHRSPLILCYDSSHFSALVAMRSTTNCLQAVPIVDRNRNLLPVHFAVDPGSSFNWWKDAEDQRIASELDSLQTDDRHLDLICKYMDVIKMDLRRGIIKKNVPVNNGSEFAPSVPLKLLALASGSEHNNNGHASRLFTEIRQHFRWLSKKSKRKNNRPLFSATELRQSNCVLTVLLHNFGHQYIDAMLDNYITGAKDRFEKGKIPSAITPKKNRISRSFSSSSVLLTCLNQNCNKTASPSTNFLCSNCFDDQNREMLSIGSSSTSTSTNASPNSHNSQKENNISPTKTKKHYEPSIRTECSKSSTMPSLSKVQSSRQYYNAYSEDAPIRYVDESASSTVSSRNGRYISPPSTALTRYFYEKDDDDNFADEPTVLAHPYRASFDYNPPLMSYSPSPPHRNYSTSPITNNSRIQSPVFYATPYSLPRVSLSSYRQHEFTPKSTSNHTYPNNVSCVKYSNDHKTSNGLSFYYAQS